MSRHPYPSGRPLIAAGAALLAAAVFLVAGDRPRLLRPAAGAADTATPVRVPFGPGVAFGAASSTPDRSRQSSTLVLERALGRRLTLHRIYQAWEPRLSPLARWDLAAGRLPVLSVNPSRDAAPVAWSAIAAGARPWTRRGDSCGSARSCRLALVGARARCDSRRTACRSQLDAC